MCETWFRKPIILELLHLKRMTLAQRVKPWGLRNVTEAKARAFQEAFEDILGVERKDERFLESFHGRDLGGRDLRCRTVVLATNLDALDGVVRFTSYPQSSIGYSILEVMMAAVALPGHTLPVDLPMVRSGVTPPNMKCVAASVSGHANPSFQALIEAEALWTPRQIHSLVSIGCGMRKRRPLVGDLGTSGSPNQLTLNTMEMMGRALTDPERTELQVHRLLSTGGDIEYRRFNTPVGAMKSSIGDWNLHASLTSASSTINQSWSITTTRPPAVR